MISLIHHVKQMLISLEAVLASFVAVCWIYFVVNSVALVRKRTIPRS
jgi:hypothetical protein